METNKDKKANISGEAEKAPLENGYRQAVVTSLSILLGFSFTYLHYFAFDTASGEWSIIGLVFVTIALFSISMLLYTLWRVLQPEDNELKHYRESLKYFRIGIILLLISMIVNLVNSIAGSSI